MASRKVKIVATLGPASDSSETIRALMEAGMNVARLNCSHTPAAEMRELVTTLRRISRELSHPVAILFDLAGPKLRVGELEGGGPVELEPGAQLVIEPGLAAGTARRIGCTYAGIARDLKPDDRILLDDGLLELKVEAIEGDQVVTRVVVGGLLHPRKGLNLPDSALALPALTEKDRRDAVDAVALDADYLALSFVQSAKDVEELRGLLHEHGASVPIISKLERPQAIEELEAIVEASDAVMVARGDLGVEAGFHRVPWIQKRILQLATERGVPDITATQMLDSMIRNPRPTRAEVSDVANAILDGTDAVMLSGETAVGSYPVEAVRTMDRIAREIEEHMESMPAAHFEGPRKETGRDWSIARAACHVASDAPQRVIVVLTGSGSMARKVAAYGPDSEIFAITPCEMAWRGLALVRGVRPLLMPLEGTTEEILAAAEKLLVDRGLVRAHDEVILVSGQFDSWGVTWLLKLIVVREAQGDPQDEPRIATTQAIPRLDLG